uniref:Uncharacterized protein n=1 Tax=Rhizophagus irregularis (strain DAOM 181602 / DAOM 197198 / MUCL 43194) TaxID=747089 RepID=U9TAT4_RHIID
MMVNWKKKLIAYLTTLKTSFWYHQNKKKPKISIRFWFWTNVYYLDPFIKLFLEENIHLTLWN